MSFMKENVSRSLPELTLGVGQGDTESTENSASRILGVKYATHYLFPSDPIGGFYLYRMKKKCRGMMLVEALLAITILSIGLGVLMVTASRSLSAMKMASDFQSAQWVLGMAELEYPVISTNRIETLNVSDVEYPDGFTFSREVESDEDGDGLHVVRARVEWISKGRIMKEEIVSYVLELEDNQ